MALQVYTVHEPPAPSADPLKRAEDVLLVKEGFAPFAMVFGPLWLITHRMWLVLLGFVGVWVVVQGLFALVPGGMRAAGLAWTLISLGFGLEANAFRRWTLERNGYATLATVTGRSLEECEQRFFLSWLGDKARRPAAASPPPVPPSDQDISRRLRSVVEGMRRDLDPLPPDPAPPPRGAT